MAPSTATRLTSLESDVSEVKEQLFSNSETITSHSAKLDQIRRAFGFNGKVSDPEAEALIAETWSEMRAMAKARREEIALDKARALVLADFTAKLNKGRRVWGFGKWVALAIGSAFAWQLGGAIFPPVHKALQHAHLLP